MFAIAMTVGRLSGDFITARVGDRAMLFWGGLATMGGFGLVLSAPIASLAMSGFLLIGLGDRTSCRCCSVALARSVDASRPAVAAITTTGYAGVLVGPAAMGSLPDRWGLRSRFGCRLRSSARSS